MMALYSIVMAWMCAMPVQAAGNAAAGSEQQIGLLVVLMGGALIIIIAVVISVAGLPANREYYWVPVLRCRLDGPRIL